MSATSGFNWMGYVQEVMKASTLPNVSPLINPIPSADGYVNSDGTPYEEFDYMQTVPDMESMAEIGDPRFTLADVVSAAFEKYLPRINTYVEVMQAGGCQVIDNYICNADGVPIKSLSISCPEEFDMTPINPQEVVDFVNQKYQEGKERDIASFVNYITENYINKGYYLSLYEFTSDIHPEVSMFLTRVSNAKTDLYFKYYYDDREEVSKRFKTAISNMDVSELNDAMIKALANPVPKYSN